MYIGVRKFDGGMVDRDTGGREFDRGRADTVIGYWSRSTKSKMGLPAPERNVVDADKH